MTPVDQDSKLHGARASQVLHRGERGPDGAPGEQHIVDEHDDGAVHPAGRHLGAFQRPRGSQPQVVAVHRDIQRAHGHRLVLDLGYPGGQPGGQRHAAGGYAEQHHVLGTAGAFEDLVSDAAQRARNVVGVENGAHRHKSRRGVSHPQTSFPASPDGSLKDVDRETTLAGGGAGQVGRGGSARRVSAAGQRGGSASRGARPGPLPRSEPFATVSRPLGPFR